MILKIFFQHRS